MDSYLAELLPRQRSVLEGPGTAVERMQKMTLEAVTIVLRRPEVAMVVVLDWHEIVTIPELAGVVADIRETNTIFRLLLEEGMRNGELREDIVVEAVARLWGAAIMGFVDRRYLIPSGAGGQATDFSAEEVAACINMLLGGLVNNPSATTVRNAKPKSRARTTAS